MIVCAQAVIAEWLGVTDNSRGGLVAGAYGGMVVCLGDSPAYVAPIEVRLTVLMACDACFRGGLLLQRARRTWRRSWCGVVCCFSEPGARGAGRDVV